MSSDDLRRALQLLLRRVPFRPFLVEFMSGSSILVSHPESIDSNETFFLYRGPDSAYRIFHGESVCQLIEVIPKSRPS